jgi:hypothetical protein
VLKGFQGEARTQVMDDKFCCVRLVSDPGCRNSLRVCVLAAGEL